MSTFQISKKKRIHLLCISNHWTNLNHNFKWNEIKILDKEASYNKRSEMIHIKKQ